jgi:hypothetical protein
MKKRTFLGVIRMSYLQLKLEAWIVDVNREDSVTLQLFEKFLDVMFSLIKWAGIPFVIYLLLVISKW